MCATTDKVLRGVAIFSIGLAYTAAVYAAIPSKSGVRPQVISLPSGPGSIEGLGESFEVQLNSGSGSYAISLTVPPGRVGFEPDIVLQYNSGSGNGKLGMGWRFNEMGIIRQSDKGLPAYNDPIRPTPDTFITEGGEELVRVEGSSSDNVQVFRLKNEGQFNRYVYYKTEDRWEITDRSGIRYSLGARFNNEDVNARTSHPDLNASYAWYIAAARDLNGNLIVYSYDVDQNQPYCSKIQYSFQSETPGSGHELEFSYSSRTDPVIDYRPAFRLATSLRLESITVKTAGSLVRRYELDYDLSHPLSRLTRLTLVGADGTSTLPSAEFGYSGSSPNPTPVLQTLEGLVTASLLLKNEDPDSNLGRAEILDFNGDSLPDLYQSEHPASPPGEHDVLFENRGSGVFIRTELSPLESLGLPIQSQSSFVIDVNGDGLSDLVAQKGANPEDFVYRLNEGGAWADNDIPFNFPVGVTSNEVFRGPEIRELDLNFDKKIDTLRSYRMVGPSGEGVVFAAYINQANGAFQHIPQTTPNIIKGLPLTFLEGQGGVVVADMNGDRLQDIVLLRDATNGGPKYWPSQGYGRFDDSSYGYNIPLTDGPDFGGDSSQANQLEVADINGDGLADIYHLDGFNIHYWLNEGGVEFGAQQTISIGRQFDPSIATHRLLDIDGDGIQDIVFYSAFSPTSDYLPAGFSFVSIFSDNSPRLVDQADNDGDNLIDEADEGTSIPNLLTSITNGIGKTTSLLYESHVQDKLEDRDDGYDWLTDLPFPTTVLRRQEINDGLNTYVTTYRYRDGYFDGQEKEFRGFAHVEQTEIGDLTIPDLISEFRFNTGQTVEALKGKEIEIQTRETDGSIYFEEQHFWDTRILTAGAPGETRSVTFPFKHRLEKQVIEKNGGEPVGLLTEYEYDDFGNLVVQLESGRTDPGWDDERLTSWTYSASFPANVDDWILGRLVERVISDENSVQAARQRLYYDQNLVLGALTEGNVSRVEDWIKENSWQVTVRSDHDEFGNVVVMYDGLYGFAPGHYREITYDDVFLTYPVEEIIYTGADAIPTLSLMALYDARFGVMTSSTEFNNHTTTYEYDDFGRPTAVVKPGDSLAHPTTEYDYVLNFNLGGGKSINWIETRQREVAGGGTVDARSFFDGLGRMVMTRAEGESAGQTVVSDTVQYNSKGVARRRYLPYFDGGGLAYVAPSFSGSFTEHLYDGLGREIRITQPDGTFATTEYQALKLIVRDEEQTNPASIHSGGFMQYETDGLSDENEAGRLREVREPAGWTTRYTYDVLDNLTNYTDAHNNQKFISYDGLSRKTFMNDPDRGQWNYAYDSAENLIQTTDAKGQVIRYHYDGVNRILAEFYGPNGSPADVQYHYDVPAGPMSLGAYWPAEGPQAIVQAVLTGENAAPAFDFNNDGHIDAADVVQAARTTTSPTVQAANTLGQLAWVKDQSGEEHNSYDPRGRVAWTIKRIKDDTGDLQNFYTGSTYDSMDRLVQLTYPDQTTLIHQYNARGLPESMPEVVTELDYNSVGLRSKLVLSNGITTSYNYDSRLRISRLHSVRGSDGLSLQDFVYTYDGVSNITRITDQRSNQALDAIGTQLGIASAEARRFNGTQDFSYDSVYRLTQAKNDAVWGTLNWQYDAIGNMTVQNAALVTSNSVMQLGAMTYGSSAGSSGRIGRPPGAPPGPHAVTSTDNPSLASIGYDGNGNVTYLDGAALTWDVKDRLIGFKKDAVDAVYMYDYRNQRVRKYGTDLSQGTYVNKYVELREGQLLKYAYFGGNRIARATDRVTAFLPDRYFVHDHLGSTHLAIALSGDSLEQSMNFPFGSVRVRDRVSSAGKNAYQFLGKELDDESQLIYFGQRYAIGALGRFASLDPFVANNISGRQLANPQNLSPYAYALNRPIIAIDEDGEAVNLLAAGIGALAGATVNMVFYAATTDRGKEGFGRGLLGAAVAGGITGGVAGLTMGASLVATTGAVGARAVVAGLAENAAAGAIAEAAKQGIVGKGMDAAKIGVAAATNAVSGLIGGAVAGTSVRASVDSAKRSLSKIVDAQSVWRDIARSGMPSSQMGRQFTIEMRSMAKSAALRLENRKDVAEQAVNKAVLYGTGAQGAVDETINGVMGLNGNSDE